MVGMIAQPLRCPTGSLTIGRMVLGRRWCHVLVIVIIALLTPSTSTAQPELVVADGLTAISSGDTHDLGEVAAGEPAGFAFTVRNLGNQPLLFDTQTPVLAGVASSGSDEVVFVDVDDLAVELGVDGIDPGGFAVMTVAFTPLSAGQVVVTLQIQSNDPINPQYMFDLSATATAPLLVVTDGLNLIEFGEVINLGPAEVGDIRGKPLTIRNIGTGALMFDVETPVTLGEVIGGIADFEGEVVGSPLAPNGLGIVTTGFTIAQPGNVSVEVILNTNDLQHPEFRFFLGVEVAGGEEGPPPAPAMQILWQEAAIADGDTVDIGDVAVGLVVQELFGIENVGDAVLTFGDPEVELVAQGVGTSADFSADVGLDDVPPGESATLAVTFAPSSVGSRLVQVVIRSNDPTTPSFAFNIEAEAVESTAPPGNNNLNGQMDPNSGNENDNGAVNQPPVGSNQDQQNRSMCGAGILSLGPLWLLPLFFRTRRNPSPAR